MDEENKMTQTTKMEVKGTRQRDDQEWCEQFGGGRRPIQGKMEYDDTEPSRLDNKGEEDWKNRLSFENGAIVWAKHMLEDVLF